jgi:site-specific DNA recombinase
MQGYIGYIRVSTTRQGEGVSLPVQKDAILSYAERNRFPLDLWLEEMETAAKRGRPVFNRAMKLLRQGKYRGIILHKLDRGARNLKDWAEIGELSDLGVEVHFVNESLDLHSRGGRLSADIQAVVASDYIRNLREETRKGFYGRLKQGLYPLWAPLGYTDQGKGKAKAIDPVMGPLVRRAFELYGTGRYNFATLGDELYRLGLRNHHGTRVTRNGLSTMLNNPFYMGIIRIRKTNECFAGNHEPLISKTLFDRVHSVLTSKVNARTQRHAFLFRRMLSCAACQYSLIGEQHNGQVYYRCHSSQCSGTAIKEEIVGTEIVKLLRLLRFSGTETKYIRARIMTLREKWANQTADEIRNLNIRLGQVKDRLNRLTDAYLDQALDRTMFEERKKSLLVEQKTVEEQLTNLSRPDSPTPDRLEKFLELAGNAWLSYDMAFPEEKREMVNILTSKRQVERKKLDLKPSFPLEEIANRSKNIGCDQQQAIPRIWDRLLDILTKLNVAGQLPALPAIFVRHEDDTTNEITVKK